MGGCSRRRTVSSATRPILPPRGIRHSTIPQPTSSPDTVPRNCAVHCISLEFDIIRKGSLQIPLNMLPICISKSTLLHPIQQLSIQSRILRQLAWPASIPEPCISSKLRWNAFAHISLDLVAFGRESHRPRSCVQPIAAHQSMPLFTSPLNMWRVCYIPGIVSFY